MGVTGWEVTEWAVAIAAFLSAVGVIWAKAVRPARDFLRRLDRRIEWVDTQMRSNGGSSLVDKVDRTQEAVVQLRKDVAMLLEHDAERDTVDKRYGPSKE